MSLTKVQFLGSGDAFGTGGRLQTSILIKTGNTRFLIDCGTTSLLAMRRHGINPNDISFILLSHLHGDHFAGIPFIVLDAQLISKRKHPLVIAGPPGTRDRVLSAMEVMFPGSSQVHQKFGLEFMELNPEQHYNFGEISVTPYPVQHPSGSLPFALRVKCNNNKTITYTGDTEWASGLTPAIQNVDLLIAEAYTYKKKIKFHLDFQTLKKKATELQVKRLIITHMGEEMLKEVNTVECEFAEDGKEFTI